MLECCIVIKVKLNTHLFFVTVNVITNKQKKIFALDFLSHGQKDKQLMANH